VTGTGGGWQRAGYGEAWGNGTTVPAVIVGLSCGISTTGVGTGGRNSTRGKGTVWAAVGTCVLVRARVSTKDAGGNNLSSRWMQVMALHLMSSVCSRCSTLRLRNWECSSRLYSRVRYIRCRLCTSSSWLFSSTQYPNCLIYVYHINWLIHMNMCASRWGHTYNGLQLNERCVSSFNVSNTAAVSEVVLAAVGALPCATSDSAIAVAK